MRSRTTTWPSGWPSFTPADNGPTNTYQKDFKARIIAEYGPSALRSSWIKTCNALNVTSRLYTLGNSAIPILSYSEVLPPTNTSAHELMKATGCFIIRGGIPNDEAVQHFEDLKFFIAENNETITGWPAKSVAIYHLYSTPTQLRIKTNPRYLKIQQALNALWTDSSCSAKEQEAIYEPILYPDGLRIRQPRQEFLCLGPHIDGGSLARWADTEYRKTYNATLSGFPESYGPYSMSYRKNANPAIFPAVRNPAYMILRPFFVRPEEEGEWRDPEKWKIDESGWFPGTYVWDSQLLSRESHPHLWLGETLVSIPDMEPGDTVWWHADMCHAVEVTHNGSTPASVCYIPAAPSTEGNLKYIRQHWKDLVAGVPPDDYKYLDGTGPEPVLSQQNKRLMKGRWIWRCLVGRGGGVWVKGGRVQLQDEGILVRVFCFLARSFEQPATSVG